MGCYSSISYRCGPWTHRPEHFIRTYSVFPCLSVLVLLLPSFFFLTDTGTLLHCFILSGMVSALTKDFWWCTPSWAELSTPPSARRVEHTAERTPSWARTTQARDCSWIAWMLQKHSLCRHTGTWLLWIAWMLQSTAYEGTQAHECS